MSNAWATLNSHAPSWSRWWQAPPCGPTTPWWTGSRQAGSMLSTRTSRCHNRNHHQDGHLCWTLSTGSAPLTHWPGRPTRLGLASQLPASGTSTLTASKVAPSPASLKIEARSPWPPSSSSWIILNWPDCEGQLPLISMHHGHTAPNGISVLSSSFIFIIARPGGGSPVWRTGGSRSSLRFPRLEGGRRQETQPGDLRQLCINIIETKVTHVTYVRADIDLWWAFEHLCQWCALSTRKFSTQRWGTMRCHISLWPHQGDVAVYSFNRKVHIAHWSHEAVWKWVKQTHLWWTLLGATWRNASPTMAATLWNGCA